MTTSALDFILCSLWFLDRVNTCFCVVEFQTLINLLNSVMLFKCFVGCIYWSLRELCTTLQCAVLLILCWTRKSHTITICSNKRKLEHSTQLMIMSYGPKKYNPSSRRVAQWQKTDHGLWLNNKLSQLCDLIMNCDWMTNFPSCLARRLLCHLILNCDHNTSLLSHEAHICIEHLHQIRGDGAIKYNRSIVQSSKSGGKSILLYYESNSRCAQSFLLFTVYCHPQRWWLTGSCLFP